MPRYIDADALCQKIDAWREKLARTYGINDDYVEGVRDVIDIIDGFPSADLIPEYMKHYRQGLHDAELKRNGELIQNFDPD